MANTMTYINSVTVGAGGASTIQFNSIPDTYTDLRLYLSLDGTGYNATDTYMQFNNSGVANYSMRYLIKDGASSVGSATSATGQSKMLIGFSNGSNSLANVFGNMVINIPGYTLSTSKSVSIDFVHENNTNDQWVGFVSGLWANSSAINAITILPGTSMSFVQNSTAYLYGIKNT